MKKIKLIFAIIMLLSGLGIASYPVISNMIAERNSSEAIENFHDTVENLDQEKIDAAKEAARKYNEQLSSAIVRDENGEADETGTSYVDMLGIGESLGYISIPKIDLELPIYEGTSEEVLSKGVGHMEQSSYPLGGESTHSVLTGHRGLPSAVLFTNLDQLTEGDCFYLHILDEVLAYKVDQIKVVEPNESGDLEIVDGEDHCTLVTCTPYSINSHRLLVRGVRTEYTGEEEESQIQYQELQMGTVVKRYVDVWPWLIVAAVLVIGAEAALMLMMIRRKKKQDKED